MKRVRLISASFGNTSKEVVISTPLKYKDYTIDLVKYNNTNTESRINSLHPRLKGKIPKMMEWYEYPDYDYYIWIDSRFIILDGFFECIFSLIDDHYADLFLFKHNKRSSIKGELDYMKQRMADGVSYLIGRYDGERMEQQVNNYLKDDGFEDTQLFLGGCFMYTKKLVENRDYNLMTDWFLHNTFYSIQDQLSLPYLINKHKVRYRNYPYNLMDNIFLQYDYS